MKDIRRLYRRDAINALTGALYFGDASADEQNRAAQLIEKLNAENERLRTRNADDTIEARTEREWRACAAKYWNAIYRAENDRSQR